MAGLSGTGIVSARSSLFTTTADATYKGQVTLARISLSGYTLRLATQRYVDPDGVLWDPALDSNPAIDHGGAWLAMDWQPVDAVLSVQDRRLNGQGLTEVFSTLFASYNFIGCRVEILQAFDNLIATSEFRTLFDGEIAEIDSIDLSGIVIHCVQSRKWDVLIPPRTVNITDFPNAPKQVVGAAIPIVLGSWEDGRYLYNGIHTSAGAGVARGACPMIVTDAPTSAGVSLPKLIISDDEIDQGALALGSPYNEFYMYEPNLDQMVGPGLGTLANPTDGPATLTLLSQQVAGCIVPNEVDLASTASGTADALRKDKDKYLSGYVTLDHTAAQRILRVKLPDIAPPGKFVSAAVYVYYQKNGGWAATFGQFGIYNSSLSLGTFQDFPSGAITDRKSVV